MTNNTAIEQVQLRRTSGVYFVLCGSCYWCASSFRSDAFAACPSCRNEELDLMPISTDENYVFDYDEKRGIVLDFVPARRK
jgi:hypothetical protein